MTSETPARPFLKWVGGKSRLLKQFDTFLPRDSRRGYYEPFVGSGAVFFQMRGRGLFRQYHLSDVNPDLIICYAAVRDDVETLIVHLAEHEARHNHRHFYAVRQRDRDRCWSAASCVERAARMIYLNKTCYNGLWRVNSKGHFNVPIGRYVRPAILDEDRLRAASAALAGVTLAVEDFAAVLDHAGAGDFVYFDPPYVPLSATANFTSYAQRDFGPDQQRELARVFAALDRKGACLMLSNSDTAFVRELYAGFRIETVTARRNVNSAKRKRGPVTEVVVLNY